MNHTVKLVYYLDSTFILKKLYNWQFRTECLLHSLNNTNDNKSINYKNKLNINIGLIKVFIVDVDSGINKFIALVVDNVVNHFIDIKLYKELGKGHIKYLVTDPDLLNKKINLPYKEISADLKQHFNTEEITIEASNDRVERLFIKKGATYNQYKTLLKI
jgi:ABC-type enterochelin transport system permease subunit